MKSNGETCFLYLLGPNRCKDQKRWREYRTGRNRRKFQTPTVPEKEWV